VGSISIGLGEVDGAWLALVDGTTAPLGDALGEPSGEWLGDGLMLGDSDGLGDGDSDGLSLGDSDGLGDGDALGDSDGLGLTDGDGDGLMLVDSDGLGDGDALGEWDGLMLGDGLGDLDSLGLGLGLEGGGGGGVPGQVWLRLKVASFFSSARTAFAAVSSHPASVITYACLKEPSLASSSQPTQPVPLFGACASVLVIGPTLTTPPLVEKVSVIEMKPLPWESGTTKCQPSLSDGRPLSGPSHSCSENFSAVVGTWLGLTDAANTPAARLTVPMTAKATGRPTRRMTVVKRPADTNDSAARWTKTTHGNEKRVRVGSVEPGCPSVERTLALIRSP
jgi:hypothetical protein